MCISRCGSSFSMAFQVQFRISYSLNMNISDLSQYTDTQQVERGLTHISEQKTKNINISDLHSPIHTISNYIPIWIQCIHCKLHQRIFKMMNSKALYGDEASWVWSHSHLRAIKLKIIFPISDSDLISGFILGPYFGFQFLISYEILGKVCEGASDGYQVFACAFGCDREVRGRWFVGDSIRHGVYEVILCWEESGEIRGTIWQNRGTGLTKQYPNVKNRRDNLQKLTFGFHL
jgi:hypothetical protein